MHQPTSAEAICKVKNLHWTPNAAWTVFIHKGTLQEKKANRACLVGNFGDTRFLINTKGWKGHGNKRSDPYRYYPASTKHSHYSILDGNSHSAVILKLCQPYWQIHLSVCGPLGKTQTHVRGFRHPDSFLALTETYKIICCCWCISVSA